MIDAREKRRNIFLAGLTVVLIAFLVFLVFLFLRMLRPPATGGAEVEGMELISVIYGIDENDKLSAPTGVAFDGDGNVLIADSGNTRVLRFTQRGRFMEKMTFPESNLEKSLAKMNEQQRKAHQKVAIERYMPGFVAVAPDGTVFVSYPDRNLIAVFDGKFNFKYKIETDDFPLDLAIKGNQLYLTSAHKVRIMTLEGRQLYSSGDPGVRRVDLGYWLFPNGIGVDEQGSVYVADSNNNRVVGLDPRLKEPRRISLGSIPVGVTVGPDENLYFLELLRSDLVIKTRQGREIKVLSGPGAQDLKFANPIDMAYAGDSIFAISDKANNRVQIVRINY